MNVSEQLLQILQTEGVKHIFGVAGDALNPFVSAINDQDQIAWVGMKHEGNASFAAFGQAATGAGFGVCASTVGPGALHLINGLYNAKKEGVPVIAITGQVPIEHIGTNYHQEVDLGKIFDDVCEHQAIIRSAAEAPRVILRSIRTAINNRCVCRIELPADIAEMPAENQDFVHSVFRSDAILMPSDEALNKAIAVINNASTIGILAGAGCVESREEVLAFSALLKAPIVHTLRAADIFDHKAPGVVGLTGLIGNPSGYEAVMTCDLLIMLGTDFPYTDFLPSDTVTIQVDINAVNIGNRCPVDIGLHGDVGATLDLLMDLLVEKQDDGFYSSLESDFQDWKEKMNGYADVENAVEPLHPEIFSAMISKEASEDAVFVIETGTSAIWASNFMSFHSDRRVIGAFNHGSMAVGLPAAIGAQMQHTDREVWALVGDGAFHMSMHDFTTAVALKLPIKMIVFSNEELGFVKIEMEESGLKPNLEALEVPDFDAAQFAKLCGGDGVTVRHAKDINRAILLAKRSTVPFIIDAKVSSGALSLPPSIGLHEAKNFGVSKLKEMWAAFLGDKRQQKNLKEQAKQYIDKL